MSVSKYAHLVERVFAKPLETLQRTNRKPPNRQILRLYRDVLHFCREFNWEDDKGQPWKDQLRKSSRKEFEEAREETDPLILYRMMVTARDSMVQTREMVSLVSQSIFDFDLSNLGQLIKQYAFRTQKIAENDLLKKHKKELGYKTDFDENEIFKTMYGTLKD